MMDESDEPSFVSEKILELKTEDHGSHVLVHLQSLYDDGIMCDVTLQAGDYSVRAHKIVLAANSDYFQAMFSGHWTETATSEIVLHGLTPAGLKSVIQFCYFGKLLVSFDNISEIVSAIHHCQLVKAYEVIEEYLSEELNMTNFFDLLKLADDYSLQILLANLVNFAVEQFMPSEMFHGGFLTCLHRMDAAFFCLVIKEWKLANSGFGFFAAMELIMKWVQFDLEEREKYLPELLQILRGKVGEVKIPEVCDVVDYFNLTPEERNIKMNSETNLGFVTFMYGDDPAVYNEETKCWNVLANVPGAERQFDSFGVTVLENCLYVCGGYTEDPCKVAEEKCHKYDPVLERWLPMSRLQNGRKMFPLVALHGRLYAIGGINHHHNLMRGVEVYNPADNTWADGISLPLPLASHAATVHGGKLYVSGGQSEYFGDVLACLLCFDPVTKTWGYKKNMLSARCNHMLVDHGDRLYQLGGEKSDCVVRVCSAEYYDIASNTWTELNIFQDDLNTYPYGACVYGNLFYIWFEVMVHVPQRKDTLFVAQYDPESRAITTIYDEASWMGVGAKHWYPLRFPKFVVECMPKFSSVKRVQSERFAYDMFD